MSSSIISIITTTQTDAILWREKYSIKAEWGATLDENNIGDTAAIDAIAECIVINKKSSTETVIAVPAIQPIEIYRDIDNIGGANPNTVTAPTAVTSTAVAPVAVEPVAVAVATRPVAVAVDTEPVAVLPDKAALIAKVRAIPHASEQSLCADCWAGVNIYFATYDLLKCVKIICVKCREVLAKSLDVKCSECKSNVVRVNAMGELESESCRSCLIKKVKLSNPNYAKLKKNRKAFAAYIKVTECDKSCVYCVSGQNIKQEPKGGQWGALCRSCIDTCLRPAKCAVPSCVVRPFASPITGICHYIYCESHAAHACKVGKLNKMEKAKSTKKSLKKKKANYKHVVRAEKEGEPKAHGESKVPAEEEKVAMALPAVQPKQIIVVDKGYLAGSPKGIESAKKVFKPRLPRKQLTINTPIGSAIHGGQIVEDLLSPG